MTDYEKRLVYVYDKLTGELGNSTPKVYIAGPMSGLPESNHPSFERATQVLRAIGFHAISPAEEDVVKVVKEYAVIWPEARKIATTDNQTYREAMKRDLPFVLDSDALFVLPGWEESRGALLEVHCAAVCDIPVYRYPEGDLIPTEHVYSPEARPAHSPDSKRFFHTHPALRSTAKRVRDEEARPEGAGDSVTASELLSAPGEPIMLDPDTREFDTMLSKLTNPKDLIGSDKLPLHLWPETATVLGCLALLEGMLKYGRSNWREAGVRASIYIDALRRHANAWFEGEEDDPDSGLPHLAHALACLAIVVDAQAKGKLVDDRMYPGGYRGLVDKLSPQVRALKSKYVDYDPKHWTIEDA